MVKKKQNATNSSSRRNKVLEMLHDLPRLDTRMSPEKVVALINQLSQIQKESFATTPFGHLVNLRVIRLPVYLSHYVVNNFNFESKKLSLDNGETIDVSKEDVRRVLGLPIGGVVPKYSIDELEPVFEEWINQFGDDANGRMVKMSVLRKYIISHKDDGGPMFKRNILLYIISSLIRCNGNYKFVYTKAFPWLVDVDKLDELDWCEFVHDKLLETRENWSLGKEFRGPLLFLLLHFVDTVVDSKRDVTRTWPTFIAWTTRDLNNRQKKGHKRGGFGGGFIQKESPIVSNVGNQGFVDLVGALKVSEGHGKQASTAIHHNKQVLQSKTNLVGKRLLRMATEVPEVCHAGSKLKDMVFEVVDAEGNIDQTIHDDDEHGLPHTLEIRTESTENDSLRYVFKKGRCVVPSITLPKLEGDFFIEAVHCQHPELHLKFKTTVSQATDAAYDLTGELLASEENDDVLYQYSNERIAPYPVSADISTPTRSMVQDKEVYKRQHIQECTFSSSSRTSDPKETSESNFMSHPETIMLENVATSTERVLTENLEDFKNIDAEKDTHVYAASCIKDNEDQLQQYESRKNVIEALVRKDHEELLQLQALMEPVPVSATYCMSPEETVMKKIENKIESAAALYSFVSRDSSLRDRYSMFMDEVVGIVALIGTASTHNLSRSLAEYLGEEQMLAVVCRSNAVITIPEKYELELKSLASELGTCIRGSDIFICLEDIRAFPGRLVEDDSRKRLSLSNPRLPDGTTPPGFLGFAVNMIDLAANHLKTKTSAGHGLRETLFYRLFGELQVYETKEDLRQAYCCGCAKDGALSLDGGMLRGSGMFTLSCKEVNVHFSVIVEKNRVVRFCETASSIKEVEEMVKKKHQQIEEKKVELSILKHTITYLTRQRNEHFEDEGEEAVVSDFAAKHQNLANEVGKVRPEGVPKTLKTKVKTSGSLLAEDEPEKALCEDNDPMDQADIPAGGQLAVNKVDNPFEALCVQYESRISRLEKEISALLDTKH